jgi:hypothetical protein
MTGHRKRSSATTNAACPGDRQAFSRTDATGRLGPERVMSANPFAFLQAEWPEVYEAASRAATVAYPDPRTSCFYARRALELAVAWAYRSDAALRLPYQDNLSALIHEPTFKNVAGEAVFSKAPRHQHARQSGGAQPSIDPAARRADRSA